MTAHQKVCIFCRKPATLTSEHIWGKWLRNYVPMKMNKHAFTAIELRPRHAPEIASITPRTGDPTRSKVKVVCKLCNNVWMGKLQEAAKPFLIPLFDGKVCVMGTQAQAAIATWATMATMTSEHIARDPTTIAVPQSERDWFMANRAPLPDWRIWIADYTRHRWKGVWTHTSAAVVEKIPGPGEPEPPRNTQATTFVIGRFYVHVMSSEFAEHVRKWIWIDTPRARTLLTQIWPPKEPIIVWPRQGLTDADAYSFSRTYVLWLHAIGLTTGF